MDKYFSAEDSLKADHIRDIERLKKVHGVVVVNSKSCGLSVVPLSICYRNETVRKRVPMGITIGRVFSVGSMSVKLELDKGTHMIELDNPMRSLDFYSPEPDDVLRLVTT
ncbi:unnamed protein product [Heligmosomoides polygyrus]|uniref:Uncharacterized protein n=1 Tax=Heligmosomoides polygyrus TaxID=6339 RepID=A0A3P8EFF5_HELPZ|nr:unnamed protein product [Heligmosomoides polygyrus]